ncbi:unnamed protein product [Malus baccata var. baccata]
MFLLQDLKFYSCYKSILITFVFSFCQEFRGYVFKIMGGCDKHGFPMKQGVLTTGRVRPLLHRGTPCFRGHGRRDGERIRKSVRGCIVSPDISVLNLVICWNTHSSGRTCIVGTPIVPHWPRGKRESSEAAEYQKLLASSLKEQRERRSESLAKRRSRLSGASKPSVTV